MTRLILLDERHKAILESYGIALKKEQKAASFIQLNGKDDDTRICSNLYKVLLNAADNKSTSNNKLPNFTFGVELEFVGSISSYNVLDFNKSMTRLFKEKYFFTGTYTHNDGTQWILGSDSSVSHEDSVLSKPFGYELSSPKMKISSKDDMDNLRKVLDLVKTHLLGKTNISCGTHIHIGFNLKDMKACLYKASIRDLLTAYSLMEKTVFDPIVPINRRHNRFCKKTINNTRNKYQKLSSRYCKFSVDGVCNSLRFEFRQLEGTLDFDTIVYWAELQTRILYDLLYHIGSGNFNYIRSLTKKNIFDLLFYYGFSNEMISFFIDRVISFKSRALQAA